LLRGDVHVEIERRKHRKLGIVQGRGRDFESILKGLLVRMIFKRWL